MNETREELERAVIASALNLFDYMGSASFCIPIPGTNPQLIVASGEREKVSELATQKHQWQRDLVADAVEIADEAALHEIAFHTEEVGDWRRLFVSEVDPIMRRAMHYAIRRGLIERKEGEPHLVRFVKETGG